MNIIDCQHLRHAFGERTIYDDLNFTVPQGRIMGLLGKNGTGKTTTINILNGYLRPSAGQCTIFGENCNSLSPDTKRRIGLLLEGHVQYGFMRIDQLERYYKPFYPKWDHEVYHALISKLRVSPRQAIRTMSNGQRSQVALAVVLAQNPDLLILDDFSLGLDPGYRRLFTDILREYAAGRGKTIFLTSHIIQDMERLVDDCIILGHGQILIQDSVQHLMGNFARYELEWESNRELPTLPSHYYSLERLNEHNLELFSFQTYEEVQSELRQLLSPDIEIRQGGALTLEDAFIGLTGKY